MIFPIIDYYFDQLSDMIGLPDDQLKVVFCWISKYKSNYIY